ncbi:ATP-binding cassette domain-containing protein [Mastigocladopsis repens]|uniref:ATP-binding cassette domain-containing protein n=1 Tax=Mastigocladopsis repens TaxID=221287 RepID=UPI0003003480|nr:ATP-binding cassette domain-containing protein [Mastigocladopsis repens]
MKLGRIGIDLKILGLSKSFGNIHVLQKLDLEIARGEFVVIVGRSGCGKSTLLRLLAGLEIPCSGSILLDGKPLHKLNPQTRVMFQDARLLMWKRVIENVGLGLKLNWRQRAYWALEQVGLAERAFEWPAVLSGGQRQRVALARALVSEPRLLLLDEPLGALDALTRIEMQRLIENIWQQQQFSVVLITHDVEEAVTLADRIILIEGGKVAMDLAVALARPRQRGNAMFAALVEKILERVLNTKAHSQELAKGVSTVAKLQPRTYSFEKLDEY